jgi:hypothetical protein
MNRLQVGEPGEQLLALIFEAALEEGDWPVYQHLDLTGPHNSVPSPHQILEDLPPAYVSFDIPLDTSSKVALYVRGMEAAIRALATRNSEHAQVAVGLLQAFADVLVALSERWEREPMMSASKAQPVVVQAHELQAATGERTPRQVLLLGKMLEQEAIGIVEWTDDPDSPWSIEINFEIRMYRNAGGITDYLRIHEPGRG